MRQPCQFLIAHKVEIVTEVDKRQKTRMSMVGNEQACVCIDPETKNPSSLFEVPQIHSNRSKETEN